VRTPASKARGDDASEPQEGTPLGEVLESFRRRWRLILTVFLLVAGFATVRTLLTPPVYEASARILIGRESPNVLEFQEVAQADAGQDDDYRTQLNLLESRALARAVIEDMGLLQDPEFGGPRPPEEVAEAEAAPPGTSPLMEGAIGGLLGRLTVRPLRNTRLVTVTFAASNPELAARTANKVSELFIRQSLQFRYQTSAEAGEWLAQQIDDQRKKAEEADVSLQDLMEKEGIVNIEERRTLLEQKLTQLGASLTGLKTQRLEKQALYNQMKSAPKPEELPEVMASPLVQSLRIDLANLERQYAEMREKYLEQHPEVVKIRSQIEETRAKIWTEAQQVIRAAENAYKAAAAQEQSVASALEATKREALELSRRSVQYDSLKREADVSREVLNSLLERHKQTDVAQQLTASNIRIVDPAVVPGAPARPQHRGDIMKGALWGLALAFGLTFLLDRLDNTLKSAADVRAHLEVPVLGVIPRVEGSSDLVLLRPSQGPLVEGYRVVRTSLGYSWPESQPRILVVSSSRPGEGKTVTSVNLALILASSGSRVLLIDADLRKPQAHSLLRARRTPGFSDILVGKAKPSETIQPLSTAGLSFLGAGTSAPSPADLMTTHALGSFLHYLRYWYDWTVVDTPPVEVVADPLILAPLSDGVVFVAGAEMAPRKAVRHSLERVTETGARVLGVVLNRARMEKKTYYGRYYGDQQGRREPRDRKTAGRDKVTRIS